MNRTLGVSRRSAFAAGAIAGAVDTSLTMPLDTLKTKMQLQRYPSTLACSRAIVASDGITGLYYGFRPFLVQASGKAAVRFFMCAGHSHPDQLLSHIAPGLALTRPSLGICAQL